MYGDLVAAKNYSETPTKKNVFGSKKGGSKGDGEREKAIERCAHRVRFYEGDEYY